MAAENRYCTTFSGDFLKRFLGKYCSRDMAACCSFSKKLLIPPFKKMLAKVD